MVPGLFWIHLVDHKHVGDDNPSDIHYTDGAHCSEDDECGHSDQIQVSTSKQNEQAQ